MVIEFRPMCDLLGLTHSYGGALKNIDITGKIIKEVPCPNSLLPNGNNDNIVWVQLGMYFMHMDHVSVASACKNPTTLRFINNLQDYHYVYGCAVVALPKKYCYEPNGQMRYNTVTVNGNVTYDRQNKGRIIINKWIKDGDAFIPSPVYMSSPRLDAEPVVYPEDMRILFKNLQKSSMNAYIKGMHLFDTDSLPLCGGDVKYLISSPKSCRSTSVEVTESDMVIVKRVDETNQPTVNFRMPAFEGNAPVQPEVDGNYEVFRPSNAVAIMDRPDTQPEIEPSIIDDGTGRIIKGGRAYYNRPSFRENELFEKAITRVLANSEEKVNNILTKLESYSSYDITNIKDNIASGIIKNFGRKATPGAYTGKTILQNVLKKARECGILGTVYACEVSDAASQRMEFLTFDSKVVLKKSAIDDCIASSYDVGYATALLNAWASCTYDANFAAGNVMALRDAKFLMLFLGEILKLKYDFSDLITPSATLISVIFENPYYLVYFDSNIPMADLDRLAMWVNKFNDPMFEESRCVAFVHSIMIDESNPLVNDRTIIKYEDLCSKLRYGYEVNSILKRQIEANNGYAVDTATLQNAIHFLNANPVGFELKAANCRPNGIKFIYPRTCDIREAVQKYIESGLGVRLRLQSGQQLIGDYTLLIKEYKIFEICKEIANKQVTAFSDGVKNDIIERYEQAYGIKLEDKQREAVMMDTNIMALLGGAGTGKTTTAKAILFRLTELEGIEPEEIAFVAPTGCAAKRLKASVGYPAKTIHSFLKLGIGEKHALANSLGEGSDTKKPIRAIFVDECSMITVNLMYNLLTRLITENIKIYFLGDIAQLLPIGFGKPFANMLNFLPAVTLDKYKRAEEGSMITENAKRLLDSEICKPLEEGYDFKISYCIQEKVQSEIVKICKHHLGIEVNPAFADVPDITPDDIQVVTPLRKSGYPWGSNDLNAILQPLFNPPAANKKCIYFKGEKDVQSVLRVGDRVINTKNHNTSRYEFDGGVLYENGTGITNGDIGIIYDFVDGSSIIFDTDNDLSDRQRTRIEESRRDSVFMLVEYTDYDIENSKYAKFLIPYELKKIVNENAVGIWVNSYDLAEIELAYAITTHKMQGSEAKIVICPLFSLNFKGADDFMNNHMIYTTITRAKKYCYLLGDVVGPSCTLERIRRIFKLDDRNSLFDKY